MPRLRRDTTKAQIRIIKRALAKLEESIASLAKSAGATKAAAAAPAGRRRVTLSPKRRAQLKLHGAYIGYLRHLKPRQKAEVKAIKAKKGYEAAIQAARRLRG